jgi:hypothetical protein
MDINQYAAAKTRLLNRMLAALLYVFQQFLRGRITAREWDQAMSVTYRILKPYRDEGTQLARQFYDDNRAAQQPSKERHDIFTDDHYPEQWYRQEMRPVFDNLIKHRDPAVAVEESLARATKVVEDAQRRTLIEGIRSDTDSPVRGFARFDPRPPTCAFCTMMISRGPVYTSASNAGFPFDTERLEKSILNDDTDAINELMNKWHPKCTCIVVPVYKYSGYPSESQENEALKIYEKAVKAVRSEMKVNQSKRNTRLILNKMRELIYNKNAQQDEVSLGRNVA